MLILCSETNECTSVQFHSAQSISHAWLCEHGLQHTRFSCPSPTSGAYSNSYPSCQWFHPTISSYVIPFSFCLQSFSASGSFPMSQFFTPGGQSIGVSASASVLQMNVQGWFPLGLMGWITLQFKGLSRVFLQQQFKTINYSVFSFLYDPTLTAIHDHWKTIALTRWTIISKVSAF